MTSDMEHKFTSTGIKFWRHRPQLEAYKLGRPATVISTHISPISECNLNCSYCSVSKRSEHNRIPLQVIKDYITKLQTCGLRAVILTGGGEPLMYSEINELIIWLHYRRKLQVALITNGTLTRRLNSRAWQALSWVRLSLNNISNFLDRVSVDLEEIRTNCIVGGSIIYAGDNTDWEWLQQTRKLADRLKMRYVRMLPDCMIPQDQLDVAHFKLASICGCLDDPRYFHQDKNHQTPTSDVCHQAYFRPYLSEELYGTTGEPGSVYPCDSLVLNDEAQRFTPKYQLCSASDILEFLNHRLDAWFEPCEDCSGCVFAETVDMLGQWKEDELDRFDQFTEPLEHEDFV